jgi:hypothetical protein
MPPHATLCSSICVSASVIPAFVFQHLRLSICVQHLCFSIYVSASVIQHSCSSICVIRVPASVFQYSAFQHCVSALVSSFVIQHLCLCFSNCVPASAIVFQLLCSNTCACSITNRLSSMTTLTICVSFCVPALFSHLCCSVFLCFSICVPASVLP